MIFPFMFLAQSYIIGRPGKEIIKGPRIDKAKREDFPYRRLKHATKP